MKVLHIGISGIVLVSLIGCSSVGLGSKRVDYRSGAAQVQLKCHRWKCRPT